MNLTTLLMSFLSSLLALFYMSFSSSILSNTIDIRWGDTAYALFGTTIILLFTYSILNLSFSGIRKLLRCIVSRIRLRVNKRALDTSIERAVSARQDAADGWNSPNERSLLIDPTLDR